MPVYEYKCDPCNRKFELMRPMSMARESAPCPKCTQQAPRALSVFASFTTGSNGEVAPIPGGGGGCAGGCSGCACSGGGCSVN